MAQIPEKVAEELGPVNTNPRRRSMFRLSLLIFVSGVVLGAAGALLTSQLARWPDRFDHRPPFFHDRQKRDEFVQNYLTERLQLNAEQKEALKAMMEKSFQNLEAIRTEYSPKIKEETERFTSEFASVLTEEQKKLWEEEVRNMRRKFFPGGKDHPRGKDGENGPPPPPILPPEDDGNGPPPPLFPS